jgi:hypothetical protein
MVAFGTSKTVEITAQQKSLTPCILDDDPAQLAALCGVVAQMGYEPIPTPILKKRCVW